MNLAKQLRIQAKNGRIIIAIIYKGTATIQRINGPELQWTVFPHSRGKTELGLRENSRGDFNKGNAGKS